MATVHSANKIERTTQNQLFPVKYDILQGNDHPVKSRKYQECIANFHNKLKHTITAKSL